MPKIEKKSVNLGSPVQKSKLFPCVTAKNEKQKDALRAMSNPETYITFINGIAGTGKSYIATTWGLEQFLKGHFDKIILTRPVVEAGENLGFLPGDFNMKIAPFMIPLFDILHEQSSVNDIRTLIEEQKII